MKIEKLSPRDIEKRSMEMIESEWQEPEHLTPGEKLVVKRVIHTTADFDYLENMKFSLDAVCLGMEAIRQGAVIITDTNMAKSGISQAAVKRFGCETACLMADDETVKLAGERNCTRAEISVELAMQRFAGRDVIYAVGNAPTALIRLCELIEQDMFLPKLIVGVPVGFVNVIASKEMLMSQTRVPYITAAGRKGGSTVAAAILNAILYQM